LFALRGKTALLGKQGISRQMTKKNNAADAHSPKMLSARLHALRKNKIRDITDALISSVTHRWTNRQKPSGCTARLFGPLERINTSSDGYRPRPSTALSRIQTPRRSFCLRFKNTLGKNWVSVMTSTPRK
jgi:hypothetical protein